MSHVPSLFECYYRLTVGLIVLAILVGATAIYFTRWRDQTDNSASHGRFNPNQPVAVQVASARSGSIDVTLDALGTVRQVRADVLAATGEPVLGLLGQPLPATQP